MLGVVINDETDEILLIQEKTSLVAGIKLKRFWELKLKDMWKIPGGLVDDGEYLSQAAEREVIDEDCFWIYMERFLKKQE